MENLVSQVRTNRGFGDYIHLASQQFLQILLDGYDIEQGPFRRHFYQQIQVTGLRGFTPGHRTEEAHIAGAMPVGDFQDLPAFLLNDLRKIHIGPF